MALAWTWCGDAGRSVGDGCAANLQGDAVDALSPGCQVTWRRAAAQITVSIQPAADDASGSACQQANEPVRSDCALLISTLVQIETADGAALPRGAMRCPWLYDGPELGRINDALQQALTEA